MLRWVAGLGLLVTWAAAPADSGTAMVRSSLLAPRFYAYARVVAPAMPLRAPATGTVSGLEVLPGDHVTKGALLAHLTGADVDALLARRKAAVQAGRAAVSAAEDGLATEREKRSQRLTTRLAVDKAEADLAQARAHLDTARAELDSARAAVTLAAPSDALVLSVDATNGERIDAGQSILTVQSTSPVWLRATFYGAAASAIRANMSGRFSPADGSEPIPVKVRGVAGALQPDGGEVVTLMPTAANPPWRSGEAGTVTLEGAKRKVVTAPTDALILDQGRWWVLVRGSSGPSHRRVVPGHRIGDRTVIERGLEPGERVVVTDAYLRFHRDFAAQYAQPD